MSVTVITGANRGIGLELVRYYLAQGDTVYGVCRTPSPELEASGASVVDGVDVADSATLDRLAVALEGETIDLLVNNAGILTSQTLENMDYEEMERQFRVNALGPLRVTERLLGQVGEGGKICMVTSRMGSIDDNTSGSSYGYRMSKAALNMASVSLAHDLKEKGVSVAIVHPGFVKTGMVGFAGNVPPEEAAADIAARIDGLNPGNSGTFWHAKGEILPW